MSTPLPAATVVLLRPGTSGLEVLLTRRPVSMVFAPDMHVFPGGRVDDADADPRLLARSVVSGGEAAAALGGDLPPTEALAAYVAAIREAFEEVGVLLADHPAGVDLAAARHRLLASADVFPAIAEAFDLRLRTDRLVPLSRWVTPPIMERRFDARFFAADLPEAAEATLVGEEVVAHGWHRPVDALESMARGELGMWLPTSTTLTQLLHVSSIDEIRARLAPGRLGEVGVEEIGDDIVRIEMPAGGGVAGQPVNAYLVGRKGVSDRPGRSDRSGSRSRGRRGRAAGRSDRGDRLTSAEPDHAGGAESLREQLGIEVHVGRHRRPPPAVRRGRGRGWASIDAGDVPVRVVSTPGLSGGPGVRDRGGAVRRDGRPGRWPGCPHDPWPDRR